MTQDLKTRIENIYALDKIYSDFYDERSPERYHALVQLQNQVGEAVDIIRSLEAKVESDGMAEDLHNETIRGDKLFDECERLQTKLTEADKLLADTLLLLECAQSMKSVNSPREANLKIKQAVDSLTTYKEGRE
jgi:hypothetical protein